MFYVFSYEDGTVKYGTFPNYYEAIRYMVETKPDVGCTIEEYESEAAYTEGL